ncbi:MAG: YciI family protein [Actinobacteria bacterium]|nr:YciI family protein [Actinomycetota bacterium]
MPNYMLLLYADEPTDEAEIARRDADLPEWKKVIDEFAASGALVGNGRLRPSETATTVQVRDLATELTDGPFAVTKEILGGYFILDLEDLDAATAAAAKLPIARFGTVEVRPLMSEEEMLRYRTEGAAAEA